MDVVTYSDARESLKSVMDRVIHDREPVVITRKNQEAAVMVSLEEYNAMMTTLQLLRSPENAERLRQSIEQLDAGKGSERELDFGE
jgi:antitoxin YefM